MTDRLQALLDQGLAEGVFPSARAVVMHGGRTVWDSGAGAAPELRYDLASLTKVLCTSALFMSLWDQGALRPDHKLSRLLPGATRLPGVTLADLLYHRAGLPPFLPFYADVLRSHPNLAEASESERAGVRASVVDAALRVEPTTAVGAEARYSDIGFILLGEALTQVAQSPLDVLFARTVATPLELIAHFRRLSAANPDEPCAETGKDRPREATPGVEARPSRAGEVDDDNAWVMDGVAGHAGLFGTARDVARFGQAVLDDVEGAGKIASAALWQRALARDTRTPGSTRAMGFDTDAPGARMAGTAVGHLGFTGVSLWIDLSRRLVVALCTNRTLFGRAHIRIREFRPRFHDAVVETWGS